MLKLGFGAVIVPAAAFAIGMLLQLCIPGCKCDSGAGCSSCYGLGSVIAFLTFGGFVAALGALIFVLPAAGLISMILARGDVKALGPKKQSAFYGGSAADVFSPPTAEKANTSIQGDSKPDP